MKETHYGSVTTLKDDIDGIPVTIEVYQPYYAYGGTTYVPAKVNWPASGSRTELGTRKFAKMLVRAADIAKKMNDDHVASIQVDGKEDAEGQQALSPLQICEHLTEGDVPPLASELLERINGIDWLPGMVRLKGRIILRKEQ